MFAMRKSDKQVRDKEARIPRSSPKSRFLVTGEMNGAAAVRPAARNGRAPGETVAAGHQ